MNKGSVLLVDDDLDMLLIGQRIFGRAGYKFISARNGKEGLEKVLANAPDLIIIDFILPDINGKQFIETIAKDEDYKAHRDTPMIILSARSDYIENLEEFFKIGLKAYLHKPFGHRELVNIVDNFIQQSRAERKAKKRMNITKKIMPEPAWANQNGQMLEDIRENTGTINALCKLLLDNPNDLLTDRQRLDLFAIQNSCKNIMKLVK